MSNRLFQGVIHQMKDAVDRTFGVIDENFTIIACSELGRIGETVASFTISTNDICVNGGNTYKSVGVSQGANYIVFVEGDDVLASKYAAVIAVSFANIKFYYDEKYDRSNFIKNIILDNILPGDIYLKARELYFNSDVSRTVILIRAIEKHDVSVYDIVQNLFPDKAKDFVININETDIALVKETKTGIESKTIEKLASTIADTISGEFYVHVVIGIGTTVDNLKDLARSFKEAQQALEVGKVFDTEKTIISYDNLGIARLIYQLPTTLC
ncbi:MAG: PucR family transcriptional regulator, partial [Acutalibacteraceae bacterium]